MKIQKLKYSKLNQETKEELNEIYQKAIYPSRKRLKLVAKKYQLKLTKVENWFKYKRRSEYKKGLLMDQDNLSFLQEKFEENERPTPAQYQEYSKFLNANYAHVKNWFAHQRQKKRMQKMLKKDISNESGSCESKETNQKHSTNINAIDTPHNEKSLYSEKEQSSQEEQKFEFNSLLSTPRITIEKVSNNEENNEKKNPIFFEQESKIHCPQPINTCNNPMISSLLQSLHQNQEAYKQLNSFVWFRNQMIIQKENYLKSLQSQYIKQAIEKINLYNCFQQYQQFQQMKNYLL